MNDSKDDKEKDQDRPEDENGESSNINPEKSNDSPDPEGEAKDSDESEQKPEETPGKKEKAEEKEPAESSPSESQKESESREPEQEGGAPESEESPQEPEEPSDKEEKSEKEPVKTSPDSVESQDENEAPEAKKDNEPEQEEYYDGYSQEYGYTPSDPENVDSTESPSEEDELAGETEESGDGGKQKKTKAVDEKKMPFLEHLEELRWTLLRSLLAIFVGAVVCFIFSKQIVDFLRWPAPADLKLIYLSPTEGFMIYIKVALFSGLVVALPYVSYEFWKFVVPGLLEKERKLVPPIVFFTVFCFALGGAFAYMIIIRYALKFLLGFQTEYLAATIAIGKYLGFVVTLILVFGVVFELPVLSFFLSKVGLLTPDFLRSKRRYGIVTIFILAAFLTPPDIMTQLMLAGPLIILYEVSVWVSAAVVRKKVEKEEEEEW